MNLDPRPQPLHHAPSTSFSRTSLTPIPRSHPTEAPPPSATTPAAATYVDGTPAPSSAAAAALPAAAHKAATAGASRGADLPSSNQPTPAPSAFEGPTTSASTGAITPTPRPSTDVEEADGAAGAWWLPQPQPNVDPNHIEWRPGRPLVTALSCPLCNDLLKEAISAPACGHCFCYDCVDGRITIGGRNNYCPVCNSLLGPNPFENNKLKYDFILDALVRKVFPRPLLDAALEVRRSEREEATRQLKAQIKKMRPNSKALGSPASKRPKVSGTGAASVTLPTTLSLALFPAHMMAAGAIPSSIAPAKQQQQQQQGDPKSATTTTVPAAAAATGSLWGATADSKQQPSIVPASKAAAAAGSVAGDGGGVWKEALGPLLPSLPRPYLQVPATLSLAALRAWLQDQLQGQAVDAPLLQLLQLETVEGVVLQPGQSLQQLVGVGAQAGKAPAAVSTPAAAANGGGAATSVPPAAAGDGGGDGKGALGVADGKAPPAAAPTAGAGGIRVKQKGGGDGGVQQVVEVRGEAPAGEVLLLLYCANHGSTGAGAG